ncbi:MAG: AraC family transcriptional regulator [Eubacteriales bacterium]|nr:AraC family transcriptional regulator [Eubacteriales bacterium]
MSNSILNEYAYDITVRISTTFEISHEPNWKETGAKFIHDIWLVLDGRIYVEQNGAVTLLEKGDVFMHQPNKLYTAYTDEGGCRFIYTKFDILLWNEKVDSSKLSIYGKYFAKDVSEEFPIYIKYHAPYKEGKYMSGFMMKSSLALMVGRIISLSESKEPVSVSAVVDKGARIEAVLRYISENTSDRLTVKQIAESIGMSEKYFISYFRKTIGQSPYNYITGLKMQSAYNHLATGKYHVYEVADMLGYTDIYTFSKAFKKYFGKSPSKVFRELKQ